MDVFGLHPERVAARVAASGNTRLPTLGQALALGGVGFCLASLATFATVAFGERWMYRQFGFSGAYLVWTLLFILLGGGVLSPLVVGPGRLLRFYAVFTLSFFLYAAGWMTAYFAAPNVYGEWIGSLAGTVLMGAALSWAFAARRAVLKIIAALFVANSAGYFAGSALNNRVGGRPGMLLWGVAFGLGLGAGLGYALYAAQAATRERLRAQT